LLILLALAVNSLYGILNNSSRGVSSLVTDFDRSVPFLSSFIIMKGFAKSNVSKICKYMVYTTGVLIILSTQFIKQHVLLDVVSAILLREYVYRAVDYLTLSGGLAWTKKLSWLCTARKNLET
jgi:hypothetical protein